MIQHSKNAAHKLKNSTLKKKVSLDLLNAKTVSVIMAF